MADEKCWTASGNFPLEYHLAPRLFDAAAADAAAVVGASAAFLSNMKYKYIDKKYQ